MAAALSNDLYNQQLPTNNSLYRSKSYETKLNFGYASSEPSTNQGSGSYNEHSNDYQSYAASQKSHKDSVHVSAMQSKITVMSFGPEIKVKTSSNAIDASLQANQSQQESRIAQSNTKGVQEMNN